MTTDTREPLALESYATFWEPLPADASSAPALPVSAKDAYQEFVNVTDDTPVVRRAERV